MIPKDLKKPIDEIKTPSNRILIICLILAIIFMGTFIVTTMKNQGKNCSDEIAAKKLELELKDIEIKRLNKYIIDKQDEDNQRLIKRKEQVDSILALTKYLNNQVK